MGLKQHGGLVTGLLAGLLGQHAQLLNRAGLRTLEAVPLGVGVLYGVALDLGSSAAVKVKRANADTGGNALTLNRDHWRASLLCKAKTAAAVLLGRPRPFVPE